MADIRVQQDATSLIISLLDLVCAGEADLSELDTTDIEAARDYLSAIITIRQEAT